MRFYFIRTVWISFILLGIYLIRDKSNDTFQTILYSVWIVTGTIYYFLSKNSKNHFILAILVTLGAIFYYIKYKAM